MNRFDSSESWTILSPIELSIKRKIESVGIPLKDWSIQINYGIKTGCNEAFIISGSKRNELITKDPKSVEIIRPILRGRDVKRYEFTFPDLWIINTHNGIKDMNILPVDINHYPAVKQHLDKYFSNIEKRTDKGISPYNLRNCAYMNDFSKQKIMYAETMRIHRNESNERFPRFSFTQKEFVLDKTCFMITGDDLLFILGVINSHVINYYIKKNIAVLDVGGFLMQKIYIEQFPIPKANKKEKEELENLVQEILFMKENGLDTEGLENKIDNLVFSLYQLDELEIQFIKDGNTP